MAQLIAKDVKWDIDVSDVNEYLDEISEVKAARLLELPVRIYHNMTEEGRHDYAYDCIHHNKLRAAEILGVPEDVAIPEGIYDPEDISDWLSDEYGYCHEGFSIGCDTKEEDILKEISNYESMLTGYKTAGVDLSKEIQEINEKIQHLRKVFDVLSSEKQEEREDRE